MPSRSLWKTPEWTFLACVEKDEYQDAIEDFKLWQSFGRTSLLPNKKSASIQVPYISQERFLSGVAHVLDR